MEEFESQRHSRWECKYHVVFISKCRRKTLYATLSESYSAIAAGLSLSSSKVHNHIAHCFSKLGVNNKVELARRLKSKA